MISSSSHIRIFKILWNLFSNQEKEQIFHEVTNELIGSEIGIEKTESVCGGEARIIRTRIPVWLLIRQKQIGFSNEELLHEYPTLSKQDLINASTYFKFHKDEIVKLIEQNEAA